VRRSILEEFPDADISASIVWIHMLPDDTKAAVEASAGIIADPRVRHFHDPRQRLGAAIAAGLGWEGQTAWDIYLFFGKDGLWTERPPAPLDFMHQLPWEPSRFRTGDALVLGLRETVQKMLEKENG
jgi:hypothetical protein